MYSNKFQRIYIIDEMKTIKNIYAMITIFLSIALFIGFSLSFRNKLRTEVIY